MGGTVRKRLTWGAAVVVGVAVLAVAVLHTPPVRSQALAWVVGQLDTQFGLTLDADSLAYNLASGTVTLANVRLAARGHEDQPFFSAARVTADLPLRAYTGTLILDAITVDQARVALLTDADGVSNLTPSSGAPPPETPRRLNLRALHISGLDFLYDNRQRELRVEATGIDTAMTHESIRVFDGATGPFAVHGGVDVAWGERRLRIEPIESRLAFEGHVVSMQELPLATSLGDFTLTGRVVRVLDTMSLELEYQGTLDAARGAEWFPPPMVVSGDARVTGAIYGPLGTTEVSARFDAPALRVGNERDVTLSGSLLLEGDTRLRVNRLLVSPASGGDIEATVDSPPDETPLRAQARFTGVDARVFMRLLELDVVPVATRLDGTLQYDSGPTRQLVLQTDATPIAERGATPLGGRARMAVQDNAWTLVHALRSDGVTADGTARGIFDWDTLLRSTMGGQSHVTMASLAAADQALAPHDLRVPESVRDAAGVFEADLALNGTWGRPGAIVSARAEAFELPGVGAAVIAAELDADPSRVIVSPLTITRGQTRASGAVTIDLDRRTLDGTVQTIVADARELQDAVPEEWRASGVITVDARIGGTMDEPVVDLTASSPILTVAGDTFERLEGRARVTSEALEVEALEVAQGEGRLAARGRYTFEGQHALTLEADRLTWDGVLVGDAVSRATITGSLSSEGAIEAPIGSGRFDFSLAGGVAGDLVGEGTLDLALNGDHVRVRALLPSLGAFADGNISTLAPYDYRGVAVLNRLDLATVAPLVAAVPGQVTGLLSLTAVVNGAASGDQPPHVEANLQQLDATLAGVPLSLAAPASATWQPGDLTVRAFELSLGSSTITASGAWAGRDDTVFNGTYRGELDDVVRAAQAFGIEAPVVARGRATADFYATGRPGELIATLELADGTLEADGMSATEVTGSVGLTGEVVTVHGLTAEVAMGRATGHFAARGYATLPDLNPRLATGSISIYETSFDAAGVPVTQARPSELSITRGIVSMDDVVWEAADSRLVVGGNIDLSGDEPALNLRLDGVAVLRVLSAFAPTVAVDGTADIELYIGGTAAAPDLSGGITLHDAEFGITSPRMVASEVSGPIRFDGKRIELRGLTGTANGGSLVIDGGVVLDGLVPGDGEIYLQAAGVAVEYPRGLRSEVDALLTLVVGGTAPVVRGDVRVLRSSYTDPISLAALARANASAGVRPAPSAIDDVRLDIAVTTVDDVRVDNNYGRFDTAAQFRVVGTVAEPGMSGRATLREGGTIYAAGRTFTVTRGTVSFANLTRIEPDLDIQAETRLSGQGTVTMTLTGTPERLDFELTSENGGSQEEIATALFGGSVSGSNALTLLSSDLLGVTGRQLGLDALRLDRGDVVRDEFREDPSLATQDIDPVTRLTLSKRLYDNVEFLVSQNLRQNGKTTFVISYYPIPSLEIRAISRDDSTLGLGVRHEITLGDNRRREQAIERAVVRVAAVTFEGDAAPVTEEELRAVIRLRAEEPFEYYLWQRDLDALSALMVERGYAESRVRGERRELENGTLEVVYRIARGPETRLEVRGIDLPRDQMEGLRLMWSRAVFDRFVVEDAEARVRRHLLESGLVDAQVTGAMVDEGAVKILRLQVTPGVVSGRRTITFQGNTGIQTSQLEAAIVAAGLESQGWIDRGTLDDTLEAYYRERGFLDAQVTVEPPVITGDRAELPIRIVEGSGAVIGGIYWNGVGETRQEAMRAVAGIAEQAPYTLDAVESARARVAARYRSLGYTTAEVAVTAAPGEPGTVNVAFTIAEGPRQVLTGVVTSGTTRTRDGVVRGALRLRIGEPVDLDEWAQARKRLYDTNVFRTVDIQAVPVGQVVDGDQPVQARVTVEEYPAWRLRYGAQVDRERDDFGEDGQLDASLGALGEVRNQNLFGRAITGGAAARIERDFQRVNSFLQNASFLGLPVRSGLFATISRDTARFDGDVVAVTDIRSISFEQRWRRQRLFEVAYGYRFESNHTFDPDPLPGDPFPLDERANIARLNAAAFADRRDSPVNATRGTFTSLSIEQAVRALGSDERYGKLFAQQQVFVPLGPMVLAARLLAGYGYGPDELIPNDRFYVGGGNTVRGYAENGLGPRNFFGDPNGGSNLLVLNQELRVPVYKWVSALGFVDAGNAFDDESRFAWGELKVGYGLGLRVASPIGLIRLDFGVPGSTVRTSSRSANQLGSGRWYFGLGHIF